MNKATLALVVALVAIVIATSAFLGINKGAQKALFGSTSCANITCLSGGLRLVADTGGDFESDVAAVFNAAMTATSATFSGIVKTDAGQLHSYANATTTISSSETLTASDFTAYDTILVTPNVAGDTTLTFPASSTVSTFLPTAGDTQYTCFVNATTTAGANIVLAGGTGFNLQVASSTVSAVGSTRIGPQKMGCIVFVRNGATATTFDLNAALTVYK